MTHFIGISAFAGSNAGSGTQAMETREEAAATIAEGVALTPQQMAMLERGETVGLYERGHAASYRALYVEACQCGWPQRH